jgi:hypothetical protein
MLEFIQSSRISTEPIFFELKVINTYPTLRHKKRIKPFIHPLHFGTAVWMLGVWHEKYVQLLQKTKVIGKRIWEIYTREFREYEENLLVFFLRVGILLGIPAMGDDIHPFVKGSHCSVLFIAAHREPYLEFSVKPDLAQVLHA